MDKELAYIREQLERRTADRMLIRVANLTGISVRTLAYIKEGKEPQYRTIKKLYAFLKETARKKAL